MKLGLVIRNASEGEGEIFSYNRELSWENYIEDVRSTTDELKGFYQTGKTVMFLKFLGELGHFICIVQAAPEGSPRLRDSTAAWIYFPYKINIDGEEVVAVINEVGLAISAPKGIEVGRLERLFEKEYNEKDVIRLNAATIKSNKDTGFAARQYGHGTDYVLHELLDKYLYQTEYNNYKSVFLLETSNEISLNNENVLKFKLKPICTFFPPNETFGFSLYIENANIMFNKPFEVIDGTKVSLTYKKVGYGDINKVFLASYSASNNLPKEGNINIEDCKRIIYRSWFNIYSKNSKKLENLMIRINDTPLTDKLAIPEELFSRGVNLTISCEGYNTIKKNNVLLSTEMSFALEEKIYYYEFFLATDICGQVKEQGAKVILETRSRLNESPIRGYSCSKFIKEGENDGRCNMLHYVNNSSKPISEDRGKCNDLNHTNNFRLKVRFFLYGFISFFFVFLLMLGLDKDNYFKENHKSGIDTVMQTETINTDRTEDENSNMKSNFNQDESIQIAAISYLDSNNTWNKDSLDNNSILKGLYEDLTEFNKDKILNDWASKLNDSEKFKKLVDAFKIVNSDLAKIKQVDKSRYNSGLKDEIIFDQYIESINNGKKNNNSINGGGTSIEGKSSTGKIKNITEKNENSVNYSKQEVEENARSTNNKRGGY